MYWLGFFVTLIVLLVAALLINKYVSAPNGNDVLEEPPLAFLIGLLITVCSFFWPVIWIAALVLATVYVVYKFILRLINKRIKGNKP